MNESIMIQGWLDRLQAGDESARQELIQCACGRLERLTRKMLHSWQRVHRWEQTGDVMQNSLLRLYRSLSEAKPARVVDFFRLAALHIRRELHDLAKHYYGPRGIGTNHATFAWKVPSDDEAGDSISPEPPGTDDDPAILAAWAEFHVQVERLPEEEREVFDLLWYQGLTQEESAGLLSVSQRTVKRRWAAARLRLHEALGGTFPGCEAPLSPGADGPNSVSYPLVGRDAASEGWSGNREAAVSSSPSLSPAPASGEGIDLAAPQP
jgi:RNA polymerase sigma-70 factor (ECF subfamily)